MPNDIFKSPNDRFKNRPKMTDLNPPSNKWQIWIELDCELKTIRVDLDWWRRQEEHDPLVERLEILYRQKNYTSVTHIWRCKEDNINGNCAL
jgi:hypothetical protein